MGWLSTYCQKLNTALFKSLNPLGLRRLLKIDQLRLLINEASRFAKAILTFFLKSHCPASSSCIFSRRILIFSFFSSCSDLLKVHLRILIDFNILATSMRKYLCWAGGEMVDAQRSGRCEAIHEGSSPSPPTN